MIAYETVSSLTKKAGVALIFGSLINILRVVPIFLSEGVTSDNFPPHTAEDIVFTAQLPLWTSTHAMALVGSILIIFGIAVFARAAQERGQAAPSLMAQIGVTFSMFLLSLGLVSDGLILPMVIEKLTQMDGVIFAENGALIQYAHIFATSFGGVAATILLLSGIFLGITLVRAFEAKIFGAIGIAIGALSLVGYVTGILSLNITSTLHFTGPLTILMLIYLGAIGVMLLRISPPSAANETHAA